MVDKRPESEPIPDYLQELIDDVSKNDPSMGGTNREALAKLQALSIMASEKAGKNLKKETRGLKNATWMLTGATVILGLITLALGLISFQK